MRTRAGQEEAVRKYIRKNCGFSVFWATENARRAQAIDRLYDSGELIYVEPGPAFPYVRCCLRSRKP